MTRRWLSLCLLAPLAACGDDGAATPDAAPDAPNIDAAVAPVFRNPVDLPDADLALQALQLLGAQVEGADRNCNACHGLTRARLRAWEGLSEDSMADCLTDLAVADPAAARPMIDCLRQNPAEVDSPFSASRLGFYAVAAHLDWFQYLFTLADPEDGPALHDEFEARVLMPRGTHPAYTQGEFDVIAEWVARGLPMLDELLPDDTKPGDCDPVITGDVAAHVSALATTHWGVVNADNGLNMFGCAGAATPRDCLASYPRASALEFGATWEQDLPGVVMRLLRTNGYWSSFWTRSSADGRFVAHGGQPAQTQGGSTIIDLERDAEVYTAAFYDPGFFPDNSGFVFQAQDAYVCDQRVLTKTPPDEYISYAEPECSTEESIGLYQNVGAALGGGDYWTVDGQFTSDNGGHQPTREDPAAGFTGGARADFIPLVFDGTNYQAGETISISTPGEGDWVLSPSARLAVSRVAGGGELQNGFRLRRVDATPVGDGYELAIPPIATYCVSGGKPGFSFDERWMAIHHYVTDADAAELGFSGPADPAFQAYRQDGAANVYLIDLVTGDKIRVTRMAPGQYALFPHFRSDGWLYFIVRVANEPQEYVVASDALLVVQGD